MSWNKFWAKTQTTGAPLPASFQGWPDTKKIEDPENPAAVGLEIYDGCLSPGGARIAEIAATLIGLAVGLDMGILSLEVGTLEFFIPAMAGVAGAFFLAKRFFSWLFTKTLWIRMFENRIEIAGWNQFQTYKSNVGYTFRLDDHEKAFDEELQYRRNPQTGRYYSNSQRLFLDHGRQPVFLADIYPKEKAKSLIGRLGAIQQGLTIGSFN